MVMQLIQTLMMWVTACTYGCHVLYQILRSAFKLGFGKVFSWKQLPRPNCLDDPTLGTHGFLKLDDIKIHYVASGAEDKPLMLFIHGFPEFWFSWRHQIKEFQKDYRVVAIDQRGYGESDKPRGIAAYDTTKLVTDIRKVIDALGYKSCVLVAHDWGGAVAWAFGRLFPDMVDKLIVMNAPPSPVFQKVLQTNKAQFKMSWYMFLFQLPCLPELYFKINNFGILDSLFGKAEQVGLVSGAFKNPITSEEIQAYKYTFSQPGAVSPPLNYYRAAYQRRNHSVKYDMNYVIPVLLIWGCNDVALNIAIPEIVEKEYPKITVKRIPEAGHFVQMDTPDLVNKAMREWLDEQEDKE